MKVDGRDEKEIGKILGITGDREIKRYVSLGKIPNLMKLEGVTGDTLTFKDAVHYLLPLRIEKGREESGAPIWDYCEVTACINKLVRMDISKDDLPNYSAERRVAIKEAEQDKRLKEIAAQEVANWKQRRSIYKTNAIPKAQNILSTIDSPPLLKYHITDIPMKVVT
jgi:hypothetical protein